MIESETNAITIGLLCAVIVGFCAVVASLLLAVYRKFSPHDAVGPVTHPPDDPWDDWPELENYLEQRPRLTGTLRTRGDGASGGGEEMKGHWSFVNGVAVWNDAFLREDVKYNYESICFAIENVKRNKDTYATVAAYQRHLSHFEAGRAMFPLPMPKKGEN